MPALKIIAISAFALLTVSLQAQDVIIFKNGNEVQARVREIDPAHIKYVRYDNQSGPLYTISRAEVFMIKYENGTKDVISDISSPPVKSGKNFGNEYRSPGLAFLFSFLLPGGGQYYNHEYVKGGVMTGLWFAGLVTMSVGLSEDIQCYDYGNNNITCFYDDDPNPAVGIGSTVMFGTWLWSVIDAPVRAAKNNKGLKATGLLEFEKQDKFSLKVEPFRSSGLGGSVTMNF